eukprot:scaffold6907_cov51-Attheya_sp.AAC.2
MPTRVTLWVKRQGSSIPVHERLPIAKKQRTTPIPSIRIKREVVNAVEEVTIKTEENDRSKEYTSGSDFHLTWASSHTFCFEQKTEEKIPKGGGFKELVDFKKINGHTIVHQKSGPLGNWVNHQRNAFRQLKEGKALPLTSERREQLESIGFVFLCPPNGLPWGQRFQELVDFKKINGHTHVPRRSGPLGSWVDNQRKAFRRLKQGKVSPLTNERRDKLESIGFSFEIYKKS